MNDNAETTRRRTEARDPDASEDSCAGWPPTPRKRPPGCGVTRRRTPRRSRPPRHCFPIWTCVVPSPATSVRTAGCSECSPRTPNAWCASPWRAIPRRQRRHWRCCRGEGTGWCVPTWRRTRRRRRRCSTACPAPIGISPARRSFVARSPGIRRHRRRPFAVWRGVGSGLSVPPWRRTRRRRRKRWPALPEIERRLSVGSSPPTPHCRRSPLPV